RAAYRRPTRHHGRERPPMDDGANASRGRARPPARGRVQVPAIRSNAPIHRRRRALAAAILGGLLLLIVIAIAIAIASSGGRTSHHPAAASSRPGFFAEVRTLAGD